MRKCLTKGRGDLESLISSVQFSRSVISASLRPHDIRKYQWDRRSIDTMPIPLVSVDVNWSKIYNVLDTAPIIHWKLINYLHHDHQYRKDSKMVARTIKYRIPKYSNRDGKTDAQKSNEAFSKSHCGTSWALKNQTAHCFHFGIWRTMGRILILAHGNTRHPNSSEAFFPRGKRGPQRILLIPPTPHQHGRSSVWIIFTWNIY